MRAWRESPSFPPRSIVRNRTPFSGSERRPQAHLCLLRYSPIPFNTLALVHFGICVAPIPSNRSAWSTHARSDLANSVSRFASFAAIQDFRSPPFSPWRSVSEQRPRSSRSSIAVLLRPLPFPEPDRLASVSVLSFPAGSGRNAVGVPNSVSYPDFFDWRAQNRSFESLASYHGLNASANPNGSARMISGVAVSWDFFHVLGVQPALGRAFTRDEEKAGNHSVVISHEFWVSDFNASPTILGQTIKLFDVNYTVVGVMPASFSFPVETSAPSFWITPARDAEGNSPSTEQRGWMQLETIGRLKPGVTFAQAQAEMSTIQARTGQALSRGRPKQPRRQGGSARRRRSPAMSVPLCASSSPQSPHCCLSPAPMSPDCCWLEARLGNRNSPSAQRSAPGGARSSCSC